MQLGESCHHHTRSRSGNTGYRAFERCTCADMSLQRWVRIALGNGAKTSARTSGRTQLQDYLRCHRRRHQSLTSQMPRPIGHRFRSKHRQLRVAEHPLQILPRLPCCHGRGRSLAPTFLIMSGSEMRSRGHDLVLVGGSSFAPLISEECQVVIKYYRIRCLSA